MTKDRLLAFTDGVVAVIITIMVLELKTPRGVGFAALGAAAPVFLSYVLSFVYVAIYWNNHHHFFHLVERVDGAVLWANLHLLFWLSLVPFVTSWAGAAHASPAPVACYGVVLLMSALAWWIMQVTLVRRQGADTRLARALGRDRKGRITPLLYLAGIGLAFVATWASELIYAAVALIWLVPDRRMERAVGAP